MKEVEKTEKNYDKVGDTHEIKELLKTEIIYGDKGNRKRQMVENSEAHLKVVRCTFSQC